MTISRRTFLSSGLALLAPRMLWAQTSARSIRVFVGCFTNAFGENVPTDFGTHRGPQDLSRGLSAFAFDTQSGVAGPISLAAECSAPVNLIMHSNRRVLYACRGQSARIDGQNIITAFAIEEGGKLRELNTVKCGGSGPTVGAVDRAGRNLLTTNFSSDSIVCFRLNPDGSLGERSAMIGSEPPAGPVEQPAAPGPLPSSGGPSVFDGSEDPKKTKPHSVVLSQSERFAIAAEINSNRCRVMRFDPASGSLETHRLADDAPGTGPRHLAWHPSYRYLYSSGEANSSISAWRWDDEQGELELLQNLTSLPEGYSGTNHPADVAMHPGGRFVYVTNRGAGTLAAYRVDDQTGLLEPADATSLGSPSCWSLRFDPTGQWALAAAMNGDQIIVYAVDQDTGRLDPTGQTLRTILPSCMRWS